MKDNKIDSSKIKILVCCHKTCELPKDDIFLPIQVGAAISDLDLGMQRDDQLNSEPCDNISAKNKSYCELTAMYWAWKNIKKLYPDLQYIGLNHYRRYFAFNKKKGLKSLYIEKEELVKNYLIDKKKLLSFLLADKILIAQKKLYPYPLFVDYSVCHVSDDLRTLRSIIKNLYPNYIDSFDNVMMHNYALSLYNMMVVGWKDYDNYCCWLFSILEEAEKKISIDNYSDVQKRIFGYMAERLFNVWLYANKIKTVEIPVIQYVDNKKQMSNMEYLYSSVRMFFSNFFIKSWNFRKKK